MSVYYFVFDADLCAKIRRAIKKQRIAFAPTFFKKFRLGFRRVPYPSVRVAYYGIPQAYFEGAGLGLGYWEHDYGTDKVEVVSFYAPLAWKSTITAIYHNGVFVGCKFGGWQLPHKTTRLERAIFEQLLKSVRKW